MSVAFEITIKDTASPKLNRLVAQLGQRALAAEVGEAMLNATTRHLRANGKNKQGWPTTNFWSRAAKATSWTASDDGVLISINQQGVRQRHYGGYLRPKGDKKFITIPACAEAYGKVASDFPNLHFGFAENRFGNLAPALLENNSQSVKFGRRRKDGSHKITPGSEVGGKVFFWLARKAFQRADPSVIPAQETYVAVAKTQLKRIVARAGGAA